MSSEFILILFAINIIVIWVVITLLNKKINLWKEEVGQRAYKADIGFIKEDVKTLRKESTALHNHLKLVPYYTSPSIIFTKRPE